MSTEPIKVKSWDAYIKQHPSFTGCLIDEDNDISWYKNGQKHRENGPALEFTNNGDKEWWLNGTYLTEHEHRRRVRRIKLKLLDTIQHSL
jgi:membrane carboxypeptidase/penicillin-binding protein PbpC